MARTKALLGAGARLSDFLSASLLARVYPPDLVNQVLQEHQVQSQRQRSLPALASTYYCMALSLYPEAAYEEVFAIIAQGIGQVYGGHSGHSEHSAPRIAKSSISAARTKLGYLALQSLHERACTPLCQPQAQPHAFYGGLRLVALDGSTFAIPDEAANVAAFGRPKASAGYPQARCALLVECASHAILGAALGPYRSGEQTLVQPLLAHLHAGMLCLADRGFKGYALWKQAASTGAHLLWRYQNNRVLPVHQSLSDGSYLSALYPSHALRRRGEGAIVVRVIEYSLPAALAPASAPTPALATGVQPPQPQRYRLVSTLLDATSAPALELAKLYHERWEVELVFDELKTHLKTPGRRTLRSKTPQGVYQEFYGWVLMHYAVCWLMHQAAGVARLKQRELSFRGHVSLLRRAQPPSGGFPP